MTGPKPNILDRAIAWVNPVAGERRMKARHVFEVNRLHSQLVTEQAKAIERRMERNRQEEARYFESAEDDDRRAFGWQMAGQTPNDGMIADLPAMRQKSRYLAFTDDYFSGAVEGFLHQTIGKGVKLQSLVRECPAKGSVPAITPKVADDCRTVLEQAWMEQAEEITDDGRDFTDYLNQILWHERVDGSGAGLLFDEDRRDRPTTLSLEVIDPWLIEPPPGSDYRTNPMGIETQNGRPVKVHFRKGFEDSEFSSAPAERFPIAFRQRWAKQQLGLPWIFAAGGRCYDRKSAMEAELIGYQIAACFAVHIASAGSWGAGDEQTIDSKGQSTRLMKNLRPGMIIEGDPGDQVTPINPGRPSNNFTSFMELNNRATAASLNYPFEYFANDFSKTTYLSGRMSQILGREGFRCVQWMLGRMQCRPIWRAFVARMALAKLLPISARQYVANRRVVESLYVQPRGYMWIDPWKDMQASIDGLDNNLTTLKDEYEQRGEDYEEKLEQRAYERRRERDLGIAKPEPAAATPANQPEEPKEPEDEDEPEGDGEPKDEEDDASE